MQWSNLPSRARAKLNQLRGGSRALAPLATYWRVHRKPGTFYAVEMLLGDHTPSGRACAAPTHEGLTDMLRRLGLRRVAPWHHLYDSQSGVWM
jgi:hypothetical protein